MQEQTNRIEDNEIDLIELFHVVLRKLWIVVLCAIIGGTTMGAYTRKNYIPQYTSSSTIYVLSQRISSVNLSLSAQLTSDFAILAKSRPVINAVIDELGLNTDYETLSSIIRVENPEESQILKFIVTYTDPTLSRDIANSMAKAVAKQIGDVMDIDEPNIVEEAVLPKGADGSGITRNIAMGAMVGIIVSLGVIFLLYISDNTIHDEEDVQKYLQLNTLATVPLQNGLKAKRKTSKA